MLKVEFDKTFTIKNVSNKKIKYFSLDSKGLFLASDMDIEFLPQGASSGKGFTEGVGFARLINFNDNCWLSLRDGYLTIFKRKNMISKAKIEATFFENIYNYILYGYKSEIKLIKIEQEY